MRIWLLSSELPQEFAGGIARYIDNFARILGAAGHEVVVVARTREALDMQLAPNVRIVGVVPRSDLTYLNTAPDQPDRHPAYPYNIMGYWPALSYQMADSVVELLGRLPRPDIIESQEYSALPYYLLHRKLTEGGALADIPVLVHLHSPWFDLVRANQMPRYQFPDYWVGQMEKFCILAADGLLSPSRYLAQSTVKTLDRPLDIRTIPLPLLASTSTPLPSHESRTIVYVGRLEVRKGVLPLVQACSRMWARGMRFSLELIGGDTDFAPRDTTVETFLRKRYAIWIEQGWLRLAGQLDHASVLRHMREAAAFVIPSVWENFPNTCMEAMGVGQVVLASRAGGQAEMIESDGVNGFLFDWSVAGEFEQKLAQILDLTPDERALIGARARERIRVLCAPEEVLPQRIAHYEEIIARARPRELFPVVHHVPTVAPMPAAGSDEQPGLVSVVIPFYNLGDYIEETLASALASTYRPLEVVIVNDGSTDSASLERLGQIEGCGHPEVRVIHTDNQGLASARNNGARAARGEYLAFLDADDLLEPEFVGRAVDVLQRYSNVTFVYSWVRYFGEANDIWPTWNAELPYMLGHNMLVPMVVARRSAFLAAGGNKPIFAYNLEDYDGWLSMVECGGAGVSLARPLARYRVRPNSLYHTFSHNQQLYLYDLLAEHHPELYQRMGAELFLLQNANGPSRGWNHPAVAAGAPPQLYVAELEQLRDRLWTENRTLGMAWESHVKYIEEQRVYIASLEARCSELIGLVNSERAQGVALGLNGSARDYELGVRIVRRMRRLPFYDRVLRSGRLKRIVKRVLGL